MSDVDRQGTIESPRAPPRHLRAVGRLEWFLFARTKAQADSCVIVAARYVPAHSGDVINKAALYPALGEVVRNNVALASRIAPASGRRGRPEWVRLPSLDLDRVVEFINDDFSNLESVFQSQFQRGFDPDTDLPLWRLAVLRDGTLLFAFDHALCDGLSGLAFHRLLLTALQENRTSPTSVQFAEGQNLPPALEEATPVSVPWRTVLRETLKLFNPFAWRRHLATWAGNRIPASFELDMRVHVLTYAPDEAQRLLSLARARGATLTATVHTLALLVLSRLLDRHAHGKYTSTRTYVPISLRRATGASRDDFCNHYSYHFSEHELFSGAHLAEGSDFPWADAVRFAEKLRAAVPHAASAMGLLKLVGSPGRGGGFVRRPLGHRRIIGIELSNLGSFSLGPEEEEELEGRRAVEVVPTAAVAVAETVKSQDASRGVGDASAAAEERAETTEIAPPTANRAEAADTGHVAGDERPATPVSMPEAPVSAAPVAETQGRETNASVPVEGDKEMSASPHDVPVAATKVPEPPPDSESVNALRISIPTPEPAGKVAFPEPESANVSFPEPARNVDDSERPVPSGQVHQTIPAKEAQDIPLPESPHDAVRTEPPPDAAAPAEAHARGRTTSESDTSPRTNDRLPEGRTKPELVSPHAPTGNASADPPHHPTLTADANPAPTGNVRNAVANSPSAPEEDGAGTDNEAGQAGGVGNGVPTQTQEPPLWALREVLFAQADGTLGAALKVCVTGTPSGGLGVVISWGRSAVDEEFGKEFVVGFADGVRELTIGGEPVNGNQ